MGCVLALSFDNLIQHHWFRRIVDSPMIIVGLLVVSLILGKWGVTRLTLSISLANVAVALAIAHCVLRASGVAGRFLNLRPIVYIGTLSYSIYLWQQLFIDRNSTSIIATFPLNLALVGLFAASSFYMVERPFLRMRPRVEARFLVSRRSAPATLGVGPSE